MPKEVKVGLTVVLAIILCYLSLSWVGRTGWFAEEQTRYELVFDEVSGLLEGDPVYVRGFLSGRVEEIVPGAKDIRVSIALDRTFPLYEDAYAEVQVKELMGGKQLTLQQGNGPTPLPAGQPIRGVSSMDFSSAFSQMGTLMNQLDMLRLNRIIVRLDTLSARWAAEITPTQVGRLLDGAESATLGLARGMEYWEAQKGWQRLDTLVETVQILLGRGQLSLAKVDQLVTHLDSTTLTQTDRLIQKVETVLSESESTLNQVSQLLTQVQEGEGLATQLLEDPEFAQKLSSTLTELTAVLRQIQEDKIIVGFRRRKAKAQQE